MNKKGKSPFLCLAVWGLCKEQLQGEREGCAFIICGAHKFRTPLLCRALLQTLAMLSPRPCGVGGRPGAAERRHNSTALPRVPAAVWPSPWGPRRWSHGPWSAHRTSRSYLRWWRMRRLSVLCSGSWVSEGSPTSGWRGSETLDSPETAGALCLYPECLSQGWLCSNCAAGVDGGGGGTEGVCCLISSLQTFAHALLPTPGTTPYWFHVSKPSWPLLQEAFSNLLPLPHLGWRLSVHQPHQPHNCLILIHLPH